MLFMPAASAQTPIKEAEVEVKTEGQQVVYLKRADQSRMDGHYKVLDAKGNYQELYLKDGVKDGAYKRYDSKGKLLVEMFYKGGKPEGKFKFYHPNGKVSQTRSYAGGKKHGAWETFDAKGKKVGQESYENGENHGLWWKESKGADGSLIKEEIAWEKGEKRHVKHYKGGQLEGDYVEFNEKGGIAVKGQYVRGKKDGVWKHFDAAGKPTSEATFKMGVEVKK